MNMEPDYSALIVDDESNLRHYLSHLLAEYWPQLTIVAMASNGREALEQIAQHQPDLLFLDIRMPGLDGISLAKQLANHPPSPLIVFTTAYDQYALDAFESEAVDYLLKPINETRLCKTIEKLKVRLQERAYTTEHNVTDVTELLDRLTPLAPAPYLEWIKASHQGHLHLVPVAEVHFFQAHDKYTSVYTCDHEYIIRMSIKELRLQLDPRQFWQIHRGTLVRPDQIAKVSRDFSGRMFVYLKNGKTKLSVSRNCQALFKQM